MSSSNNNNSTVVEDEELRKRAYASEALKYVLDDRNTTTDEKLHEISTYLIKIQASETDKVAAYSFSGCIGGIDGAIEAMKNENENIDSDFKFLAIQEMLQAQHGRFGL